MIGRRFAKPDWTNRHQMGPLLVCVNLFVFAAGFQALARDGQPLKIVAFGDSLTAGYGLPAEASFPRQLERALEAKGHSVSIINAGVSGDTTGAGLARLDWAIPDDADAVILELGANDALRGHNPDQTRSNLDKILTKLKTKKLDVLVAGMRAPTSMGQRYIDKYDPIFEQLASKHGQLYYPFFLDGVALDPKLNLDDGLHPNSTGIGVIVERILPSVEKLIDRARTTSPSKSQSSIQYNKGSKLMPRLFTGLELPAQVRQHIRLLKAPLPGAKWVDEENLHLTLRFAGDIDIPQATEFDDALSKIECQPFELHLQGLGIFGAKSPTSLWVAVAPNPALSELARLHEKAARAAGLPPEKRKFAAHVTIARFKHTHPKAVARFLTRNGGFSAPPFQVESFALFSARPRTGGGPYVAEQIYPLRYAPRTTGLQDATHHL